MTKISPVRLFPPDQTVRFACRTPTMAKGSPMATPPGPGRGIYEPNFTNSTPDMSNGGLNRRYDQEPRTRHDHHRRASHYDYSSSGSSSEDERPARRSSSKKGGHGRKGPSSRSKSTNRLDKAKGAFLDLGPRRRGGNNRRRGRSGHCAGGGAKEWEGKCWDDDCGISAWRLGGECVGEGL